ncbi:MAG: hypothetical protein DRQ54_11325 [Gammaproteobacteria bacterium]|nr:MAG: hypothetical protein DRQ54_11325 [Gammaproteobacteria bacterium]
MRLIIIVMTLLTIIPALAVAQTQQSLAATLEVYVFPTTGQDAPQQSQDEAACYTWAAQNTGTDPFDLASKAQQDAAQAEAAKQQASQSTAGAGAKGAVHGAAWGALIGEIANDDPGKGAAYGAAAGAVSSRRRARRSSSQAQEQIEQQSQQTQQLTAQQIDNFKKAFSVCLEAKNYMVKY